MRVCVFHTPIFTTRTYILYNTLDKLKFKHTNIAHVMIGISVLLDISYIYVL